MNNNKPTVAAKGHDFIEAPRISPEGDLWFSDLLKGGVMRRRAGEKTQCMIPGRKWVGGILFDKSGNALCSGRGGIVALNPQTGALREVLSEIEGQPIIAVNDMEGDGRGGLFAGTIDFVSIFEKGEAPRPGLFFHLSAAGEVTILRRDVAASNGIAASPCGKWLYHSETSRGIWRYPIGDDGMPGPGDLLIELQDSDGLAADKDGCIWVACWESSRVLRYSAEGELLSSMSPGYPHTVSLDFSATDSSVLYISTGGNADAPGCGAVLAMRVDTPGLPGPLTQLAMLENIS